MKRAEEALNKKNYEYAQMWLQQLVNKNPNNGKARRMLFQALYGKMKESGGPSKITMRIAHTKTTIQLGTMKEPKKKVEVAQQYLLNDPANSKVRMMLGAALMEMNYLDGAAEELRIAIELDPKNGEAYKFLGITYTRQGIVKEAGQALEKARALKPDDPDLDKLIRDLAATETMNRGFKDAKDFRDALKNKDEAEDLEKASHVVKTDADKKMIIDKAIKLATDNPKDVKIVRKVAELYFDMMADPRGAQSWFEKALAITPQDSILRDKIDDCKIRLYDLAIQSYTSKGDTAKVADLKQKKLAFEIESFERRVADRPLDMKAHFELGRRYFAAGASYTDKSIEEFQQSEKDPKLKVDSHLHLGLLFQRKKMYDMALERFEMSEKSAVVLSEDKRLLIWYHRMKCQADNGNIPKAVEIGKAILGKNFKYKDVAALVENWQKNGH